MSRIALGVVAVRPLDGDGINGAQYDMGAYEFVLMAQCGNGSVEPGEFCDSGANNGMYGYCSDGFVRAGTEQCDDGNNSNTDACTNQCMNATCGDGYVRAGVEACDDGNQSNSYSATGIGSASQLVAVAVALGVPG